MSLSSLHPSTALQPKPSSLLDLHDGVMAGCLKSAAAAWTMKRMKSVLIIVCRISCGRFWMLLGHLLDWMKAAATQRDAWVCGMRVRVLQMVRTVMHEQSLEAAAYHDAI